MKIHSIELENITYISFEFATHNVGLYGRVGRAMAIAAPAAAGGAGAPGRSRGRESRPLPTDTHMA